MIRVEGYEKSYGNTIAVRGLTFDVAAGSVLGIVGPNGAGKTTTMRALAGIIHPSAGRLMVADHDVVADPMAAKKELAFIPDEPQLFDVLTVWEHLEFTASVYRMNDFREAAERLLEQFELTEKRNTIAQELSRGMRQKVAICCGYLHQPKAIIFDEPLTGLDPRGIRTLKTSIRERAANGAAIMVSSHLLDLIDDLCSHLLILHRGESLFQGTIAEAKSRLESAGDNTSLEDIFFEFTERRSVTVTPP
ncbi:ABC transporter ATP-binding protein [Schlesneria sp. DSM 10557]|uniref:ABC transporter ATP-binding protein n=1 Tax=Schlesneria sp. DSM 10557 TaxID=3044399 RepID=UPI0035A1BDEC